MVIGDNGRFLSTWVHEHLVNQVNRIPERVNPAGEVVKPLLLSELLRRGVSVRGSCHYIVDRVERFFLSSSQDKIRARSSSRKSWCGSLLTYRRVPSGRARA